MSNILHLSHLYSSCIVFLLSLNHAIYSTTNSAIRLRFTNHLLLLLLFTIIRTTTLTFLFYQTPYHFYFRVSLCLLPPTPYLSPRYIHQDFPHFPY